MRPAAFRRFAVAALLGLLAGGCATTPRGAAPALPELSADDAAYGAYADAYFVQHRLLPAYLFGSLGAFFDDVRERRAEALREIWDEHVRSLPGGGLDVELETDGDSEVLFLIFPDPPAMPLAHYAALVRTELSFRYLTFERTFAFSPDTPMACLCEWVDQGGSPDDGYTHANYGPRPFAGLDAFKAEVRQLLAQERAQRSPPQGGPGNLQIR